MKRIMKRMAGKAMAKDKKPPKIGKPLKKIEKTSLDQTLSELFEVIQKRRKADPQQSYVAKLFSRGRKKISQKVGEEAVETVIAALTQTRKETVDESADLLFHLLILWAEKGVRPEQVSAELRRRMGLSGLDEKAARAMKG